MLIFVIILLISKLEIKVTKTWVSILFDQCCNCNFATLFWKRYYDLSFCVLIDLGKVLKDPLGPIHSVSHKTWLEMLLKQVCFVFILNWSEEESFPANHINHGYSDQYLNKIKLFSKKIPKILKERDKKSDIKWVVSSIHKILSSISSFKDPSVYNRYWFCDKNRG